MTDSGTSLTREELLRQVDLSWNALQDFIASCTEQQLTGPTDAAGWTVKDHLMHLAVWEMVGVAIMNSRSKRETLDLTQEIWDQGDDPQNAVLQERYRDWSIPEVLRALRQHYDSLLEKVHTMSDEELRRPYNEFQPGSTHHAPISETVRDETVHHFGEHLLWMKAILHRA